MIAAEKQELNKGVDVVLVNWNSGSGLATCLQALGSVADIEIVRSVVVVDNGSEDGSADGLPDKLGQVPVLVVRNERNCGFGAACNQGVELGKAPYVLFLNTDVEVKSGSLAASVAYLDDPTHDQVGVCGVQLHGRSGVVARSCAKFPTASSWMGGTVGLDRLGLVSPLFVSGWDHGDTREVDHVMGAFYLIRRSLFEQLGGFDTRFFVFYEDLDLSLRAQQAGWSTVYLASSSVVHSGEAAARPSAVRQLYARRSRIAYGYKHFSRPAATAIALLTLVAEPVVRVAYAAVSRQPSAASASIRSTRWLWRDARALLTGEPIARSVDAKS